MSYLKLLWLIPAFIIGLFIYGVIRGGMIMHEQGSTMREECVKTDLYVIGDKGHRNRIYDCSGIEL